MTWREINRYQDELQNYVYKCKCGHSVLLKRQDKKRVCSWCGRNVYRSEREEFIDRLETKLYGRKD